MRESLVTLFGSVTCNFVQLFVQLLCFPSREKTSWEHAMKEDLWFVARNHGCASFLAREREERNDKGFDTFKYPSALSCSCDISFSRQGLNVGKCRRYKIETNKANHRELHAFHTGFVPPCCFDLNKQVCGCDLANQQEQAPRAQTTVCV